MCAKPINDPVSSFPPAPSLCPPLEEVWRIHDMLSFKLALVEQLGIEEGFRFYRSMLRMPESTPLVTVRLESLRTYAERYAKEFTEVYPSGEPYAVVPPNIVGLSDARTLTGLSRSFYVTCIDDATIHTHGALIQTGRAALLDYENGELTSFHDFVELDPRIFHATEDRALVISEIESPIEIDEAFGSLIGPHAHHFGHWLWEYLPKYAAAVSSGLLPPVPILISDRTPATLLEALALFAPAETEIVRVPFAPIRVRRLWCAPALMYEPLFEHVDERWPGPDHRCFPPARFRPFLSALARVADAATATEYRCPERLYLARKAHRRRRLLNSATIESMVAARGFTVIYPEEHSFIDQLRYARHARFVIGPEGSQLVLNFAGRPGTKLCILNHPFVLDVMTGTYLFQEAGVDVTILSGRAVQLNNEPGYPTFGFPQYADYEIDEARLSRFLDEWLDEGSSRA